MKTQHGGRQPDEILADIDRTRAEMDGTLAAIERRLTPGQLFEQGLTYFRGSGANEFVRNLGGAVRQNPLPATLAGIGIAWLMALGREPAARASATSAPKLHEAASSARERAGEAASTVRQRAGEAADSFRARSGHIADATREGWRQARGSLSNVVEEMPLVLGAIGLAFGAALAAATPRTQTERRLTGDGRDSDDFDADGSEAGHVAPVIESDMEQPRPH